MSTSRPSERRTPPRPIQQDRPHHDYIANLSFVNLRVQAQAVGHLLIAGILEHGLAAANQNGNF
jgi:hypothetical protein